MFGPAIGARNEKPPGITQVVLVIGLTRERRPLSASLRPAHAGASFLHPKNVFVVRRTDIKRPIGLRYGWRYSTIMPFFDLGVTVSEGESSCIIVIAGGIIND